MFLRTSINLLRKQSLHLTKRQSSRTIPTLSHLLLSNDNNNTSFTTQYRNFAIKRKWVPHSERNKKRLSRSTVTNANIRRYIGGVDVEIRLVFADGSNALMTLEEALHRGKEEKLDVLLVSKESSPPTCKILDIELAKFKAKKQEKERKKLAPLDTKTLKFKVKIEKGDFLRKQEQARAFLIKGHNVTLQIVLVPRYPQGEERARFLFEQFCAGVDDLVKTDKNGHQLGTQNSVRTCMFFRKEGLPKK